MPPDALHLLELTPETAILWFALDPPPQEALQPALDYTTEVLAGGLLEPALLMVGFVGEEVVGRFQAVLDDAGRLGVWAPQFREGLDEEARRWFSAAFLEASLTLAETRPRFAYAETELPRAWPFPEWREALVRQDFAPVANYHLYDRPLEGRSLEVDATDALEWVSVDEMPESVVVGLLAAMRADSHDRIHRISPDSAAVHYQRLRTQPLLKPDYSTWWVALEGDRPVGIIFTSLEAETFGDPDRGWILEIGVAPAFRGRGLAKILLQRGLIDLARRGASTVRARIDDDNQPSIRLHLGAGFEAVPEHFEVLWRPKHTGFKRHWRSLWRKLTKG